VAGCQKLPFSHVCCRCGMEDTCDLDRCKSMIEPATSAEACSTICYLSPVLTPLTPCPTPYSRGAHVALVNVKCQEYCYQPQMAMCTLTPTKCQYGAHQGQRDGTAQVPSSASCEPQVSAQTQVLATLHGHSYCTRNTPVVCPPTHCLSHRVLA
jgi:hypothetical protein